MPLDRDFQKREILRLLGLYRKARREVQAGLRRVNATAFQKVRGAELLREIDSSMVDLKAAQQAWIDQTLPGSYRAGMRLTARASGLDLPTMSSPHRAAIGAIAGEIAQQGDEALSSVAPFVGGVFRRAQQQVLDNRQLMDILGVSTVQGLTVQQLTQRLASALKTGASERLKGLLDPGLRKDMEDLANGRVIHITGKDGKTRAYGLEWYGETVGRSATRMAASEGVVQTQQEYGEELVQVSVHSGACPLCIPWQGKIFSIHGNGSGFPPLSGENRPPLHPRCEHVLLPVVKAFLQSRGLHEHMQAFSNAPDQHVESIAEYTDLLAKKPIPVRPLPPPPPTKAPRKRVVPPPVPPAAPEAYMTDGDIAAQEAAILAIQNEVTSLWKEKITVRPPSGVMPLGGVTSLANHVWLTNIDASQAKFAGVYHWNPEQPGFEYKVGRDRPRAFFRTEGKAGMAYSDYVTSVLRTLTYEYRLRQAIDADAMPRRYLQEKFGTTPATATITQLREAFLNSGRLESDPGGTPPGRALHALKTVAHETAHSIYAEGANWMSYGDGGHAGAWQEAATELWAIRHWQDMVERFGVDPKRIENTPHMNYVPLVNALHGVLQNVLGYAPASAEYEATLLEFKFGVPIQARASWLATKVSSAYALPEEIKHDLYGTLVELFQRLNLAAFHEEGGEERTAVFTTYMLRKSREALAEALRKAGLDPNKEMPFGWTGGTDAGAAPEARRYGRRRGPRGPLAAMDTAGDKANADFRDNVRSVRGRHYSKGGTVYFDFVRPEIEALPNGARILKELDSFAIAYSSTANAGDMAEWLKTEDGRVYLAALHKVLKQKLGSDTITLYRGHADAEWEAEVKAARKAGAKTVEVDFADVSSWTTDPKVAEAFAAGDIRPGAAGRKDLTFSMTVPITDIVMTPMWAPAWTDEYLYQNEFMLGPLGKVKVTLR